MKGDPDSRVRKIRQSFKIKKRQSFYSNRILIALSLRVDFHCRVIFTC